MTRLRLFFLLTAMLALATAFAACGGDDGGGDGGDPQAVVDRATFKGVESGDLDLSLAIDVKGDEGGRVDVSLSGPFEDGGEDQPPQFDLTAEAKGSVGGEDIDFEGGLVLLSGKAFVDYEGVDYEVDPITFSFVETLFEEAQKQEKGQAAEGTACEEAVSELEVGNFIDNLSDDGSASVDGTSTTKVSGDLDVPGAFDALTELIEEPACKAQLDAAGPLPAADELDEAKGEVEGALKETHVDLYVGGDDIVRRVAAQFSVEPEEAGEVQTVDLDLELSLNAVNEEQEISAPGSSKPLSDLFIKLGINPLELLGAAEGGDIGGLLEGLGSAAVGGSSSGGGSGGGSSSGGESSSESGQQAYLDCLKGATTPVDIQRCTAKLR